MANHVIHWRNRPHRRRHPARRKGIAVLLTALMLLVAIPMIGLAVDAGVMYVVKGKLNAAVDAAALGAGRSLNLGNDLTAAQTSARAAAAKFFAANFPSGYMGTDPAQATVSSTFTQQLANGIPNGVVNVTVSGSVVAPTYFMRMLSVNNVTIAATGTASRRSLVMVLVLDKSSSMGTRGTNSSCDAMVAAAQSFITNFTPYDYVGMVSFDYTASLDYALSTNFKNGTLNTAIGNIACNNNTNTTAALELAYQQILAQNWKLALNVVVLFTDGVANGITANFPLRRQVDTRWGPATAAPAPPAQVNPYSCTDNSTNGKICVNMPVSCTSNGTVHGTLTQVSGVNSYGGATGGLYKGVSTDAAIVYPAGCNTAGTNTRQMIANIPTTDAWGNATTGFKDGWLFQVNNQCSPDPSVNPNCKNIGDLWSSYAGTGTGSNVFAAGTPYAGLFRPDQPNTIVAVSMNTAVNEANKIRANTDFHIMIDGIYLVGNGGDPVDRDFLPIMCNLQNIPPLIYQAAGTAITTNPYFVASQQQGLYLATANKGQLQGLFGQIASSLLRLSQ